MILAIIYALAVSDLEMIVKWLGVQVCVADIMLRVFCDQLFGLLVINWLQSFIH
jgi:hypothetical protein